MTTLPIRIAIRVDFSDGSQHEYEVRGQDTAEPLPGFWPEGVVTTDVRRRMEHDRKQQATIKALRQERDEAAAAIEKARAWSARIRPDVGDSPFLDGADHVLGIIDGTQEL